MNINCYQKKEPSKLFEKEGGSCFEKNIYLGNKLEEKGYEVEYWLAEFDWRELPLSESVVEKRDGNIGEHVFIKVKVNGKWLTVDATWSPELSGTDFPVVKNWDGESDTKVGVPVIRKQRWKDIPETLEVGQKEFFKLVNEELDMKRK